jgi:hypothetical protein
MVSKAGERRGFRVSAKNKVLPVVQLRIFASALSGGCVSGGFLRNKQDPTGFVRWR